MPSLDWSERLRLRLQAARQRLQAEMALEDEIFSRRFEGSPLDRSANFQRWGDQHQKVIRAMAAYSSAVNAYIRAMRRASG